MVKKLVFSGLSQRAVLFFVLALAVIGGFGVPLFADKVCQTYEDSKPAWMPGYGEVCAFTGSGCTECTDTGSGDSCTTAGDDCEPFQRPVIPF
jgi:hypothetical protein